MRKTNVLEVVARKLAPFVMLFGLYVVTHGHLSPGGGFQGGVVLASGMLLLLFALPTERVAALFPPAMFARIEVGSAIALVTAGLLGLVVAGAFFAVLGPTAGSGTLADAPFLIVLNVLIGLKVGAGISLIAYYLVQGEEL